MEKDVMAMQTLLLETISDCMGKLEFIDNPLPADDAIQCMLPYLRLAIAALDAAEGLVSVPRYERKLWEACAWISLQKLMTDIPRMDE